MEHQVAVEESAPSEDRPDAFPMAIQGGMLEALGINMYTTIGKCLVEFVANAYDSDAASVELSIPFDRIAEARREIRAEAKAQAQSAGRTKLNVLLAPLPHDIVIEIRDSGHGMSPSDVRDKFMPINRKRRLDRSGEESNHSSESGRRFVMGRKGLGKLAGFGAAERIEIETKREGETFSTTFVMDFNVLRNSENLAQVQIPASYSDGLDAETHGTTVRLLRLKCDAVSHSRATIEDSIATAFYGIEPADFSIAINDAPLEPAAAAYEFTYSPAPGGDGFTKEVLVIDDVGSVEFDYIVKFRARVRDPQNPDLAYGSLEANKRGARIYCNKRLAAGPTLFLLKTGMHNFYATDYMECIIRADEIDRQAIDFVNTNRTQLREDNEIVQRLVDRVSEIMRLAIYTHSQWRDEVVRVDLDNKIQDSETLRWIQHLPNKQQGAARNVLKYLATTHDLNSPEFDEIAPHFMDAMNASDVLGRLIALRTDPESMINIANHLSEWHDVERRDVLKHYRARRNAIVAVERLLPQLQDKHDEADASMLGLHRLLKQNPWMVRPEYANFVASERALPSTLTAVAEELRIDEFGTVPGTDGAELAIVLGNQPSNPYQISLVLLKPLNRNLVQADYQQLKGYVRDVELWAKDALEGTTAVHGMLVGKKPERETTSREERGLLYEMDEAGTRSKLEVIGLEEMLSRARVVHLQIIQILESEESEDVPADIGLTPSLANLQSGGLTEENRARSKLPAPAEN